MLKFRRLHKFNLKKFCHLVSAGTASFSIALLLYTANAYAAKAQMGLPVNDRFGSAGHDFNAIFANVIDSISDLPTLLTGIAYILGLHLAVMGIFKIKEHVESPNEMMLKNGAIQLAGGGGLFALPAVSSAMFHTVGHGEAAAQAVMGPIVF